MPEPPIHTPSDSDLLALAQQGDLAAFTTLYLRHRDFVFRLALRFTQDHAAAPRVSQDTFAYLLRKLPLRNSPANSPPASTPSSRTSPSLRVARVFDAIPDWPSRLGRARSMTADFGSAASSRPDRTYTHVYSMQHPAAALSCSHNPV